MVYSKQIWLALRERTEVGTARAEEKVPKANVLFDHQNNSAVSVSRYERRIEIFNFQ